MSGKSLAEHVSQRCCEKRDIPFCDCFDARGFCSGSELRRRVPPGGTPGGVATTPEGRGPGGGVRAAPGPLAPPAAGRGGPGPVRIASPPPNVNSPQLRNGKDESFANIVEGEWRRHLHCHNGDSSRGFFFLLKQALTRSLHHSFVGRDTRVQFSTQCLLGSSRTETRFVGTRCAAKGSALQFKQRVKGSAAYEMFPCSTELSTNMCCFWVEFS